jgi:hypothetical protein
MNAKSPLLIETSIFLIAILSCLWFLCGCFSCLAPPYGHPGVLEIIAYPILPLFCMVSCILLTNQVHVRVFAIAVFLFILMFGCVMLDRCFGFLPAGG